MLLFIFLKKEIVINSSLETLSSGVCRLEFINFAKTRFVQFSLWGENILSNVLSKIFILNISDCKIILC